MGTLILNKSVKYIKYNINSKRKLWQSAYLFKVQIMAKCILIQSANYGKMHINSKHKLWQNAY